MFGFGKNKSPRFVAYEQARERFEAFLQARGRDLLNLTPADHLAAQADASLREAEALYIEATTLTAAEKSFGDIATALCQLGMLCHCQARWPEAVMYYEEALALFLSMPRSSDSSVSHCRYHLALVAMAQGRFSEARREIEECLRIDEATVDLTGMTATQRALALCPPSTATVPLAAPTSNLSRIPWLAGALVAAPPSGGPVAAVSAEPAAPPTPGLFISPQVPVLFVLSHSVAANDRATERLTADATRRGDRLVLQRAASGASSAAQRALSQVESNQFLCGALLVVEREGLQDPLFREWMEFCISQVSAREDFRLFVCLKEVPIAYLDLARLADPLLNDLLDTVQLGTLRGMEPTPPTTDANAAPSDPFDDGLGKVSARIDEYLAVIYNIRAEITYRTLRDWSRRIAGWLAALTQLAAIPVTALAVLTAYVLGGDSFLGQWVLAYPGWFMLASGIILAPMQLFPLYFLARGILPGMRLMEQERGLTYLFFAFMIGSGFIGSVPPKLELPWHWLVLGLVVGLILDTMRRDGAEVRGLLNLGKVKEDIADPALFPFCERTLRLGLPHPLFCPLFAPASPKVFISYRRRSEWSQRIAWALYNGFKDFGTEVFFDLPSIQEGSSWRGALREHLAEANVFILLLDEQTVDGPWVAAEALAALMHRQQTNLPQILILRHSDLVTSGKPVLPVFQAILDAADLSAEGQARTMTVSEATVPSIVAQIRPYGLRRNGAVPAWFAPLLAVIASPLAAYGATAPILGLPALVFGALESWGKYTLSEQFTSWGILDAAYVLACYSLGFVFRLGVTSHFQVRSSQKNPAGTMLFCSAGFLWLVSSWTTRVDAFVIVCGCTAAVLAWIHAGTFLESIRRSKRDFFYSGYEQA